MRFVSALLLHTVKGRGLFPVYGRPRSSRNAAPCDSFWAEFIGHSLKLNTTSAPKARSDEARAAGSFPKVKGWVTCPEATSAVMTCRALTAKSRSTRMCSSRPRRVSSTGV